jgi:aminoglycoside phosphotransferase (APT) family kinase protein
MFNRQDCRPAIGGRILIRACRRSMLNSSSYRVALMKMHDGEVPIDAALVQRLVADQFPDRAGRVIREVQSTGTVNAIYRVGEDAYARLPRLAAWAAGLQREAQWLPWLAERLSLPIPEPLGAGHPSESYPFAWALYRWIDGEPYTDAGIDDEARAARDLAGFVLELRGLDGSGAPAAGRRPLRQLDAETRAAIESGRLFMDSGAALAVWDDALESPVWTGDGVWIHADLLRPNVLTRSGRVSAIIDFGSAGVGDPAADVIAAWSIFGPMGREQYRSALNVDDDTWRRARGFALHQAAIAIPYYAESNPRFAALSRRTIEQVVLDASGRR